MDEYNRNNIDVLFLVRDDYVSILKKLTGCEYRPYSVPVVTGRLGYFINSLMRFRRLYHPADPWIKIYHKADVMGMPRVAGRLWANFVYSLARFQWILRLTIWMEGVVYKKIEKCEDLDCLPIDMLLVMSVGSAAQPYDIRLTWWAYRRGKPVVHLVGNYDGLSSHGFRGVPVQRLLVWGDQMFDDAVNRHRVPEADVRKIGPLRYNMMPSKAELSRDKFLRSIGFDPEVKTIVFGGSSYEYQYFEILAVYKILKEKWKEPLQLIVRVYPNAQFLDSPYLQVLMSHLAGQKNIWVSVGDPNFRNRRPGCDVIEIDEVELWQLLNAGDMVVNLFSTLALEACMFDKPVVHMWYFPTIRRALVPPTYFPSKTSIHNKRAVASGAVTVAESREALVDQILSALQDPHARKENRENYIKRECGKLDNRAVERLVDNCVEFLK